MDYMICTRNVTRTGFGSEPGPARFLSIPTRARRPTPAHAVPRTEKDRWVERILTASKKGANPDEPVPEGDILIFVHGYNNSPEIVLARQRQLSRDLARLKFDGVVIGFDWPSGDRTLNYLEDRSDARKTALHLVKDGIRLFAVQQARGCEINVHLLAHSTGAFVIREAFDDADDSARIANVNWTVSQVMFIGADVSRRSMSRDDSKSSSIYRHCVRLTNYSNPYDSVLKLSNIKRVGVAPRVGRIGLPGDASAKAVNVHCGAHFKQLRKRRNAIGSWPHSWHIGDRQFTKDLLHTLRGDVDRHHIETRARDEQGELMLRPLKSR